MVSKPSPVRVISSLLTLHLPAAVGLATGRSERLLALAADGHVALELTAVRAARLVRADGRHRALMPGVRVGPRDGLTSGNGLEGLLLSLRGEPLVALVEHVAGETTQERAADDGCRDGRTSAAGRRRDQPSEGGAPEGADARLRVGFDGGAAGERDDEHDDRADPHD